jgi:hypothetical protein
VGRRFADDDRALLHQCLNYVVIGRYMAEIGCRTIAGFDDVRVDQVLDGDGKPFKRSLTVFSMATIALRGSLQRTIPIDCRECIEGSLAGFRVFEHSLCQCSRGDLPHGKRIEYLAKP